MLRFFRSNQFFVVIPLVLYVLAVHFGAFSGAIPAHMPVADTGLLFEKLFGWALQDPFVSSVVAVVLVIIQAISIHLLADEFRLMGDRNWLPGLFYALTASALPEFLFLSAPLVATTFVPFSIWCILRTYQKPNVPEAIFDGALWIAIASLVYPPALFLLVAAFGGFSVVRSFRMKEQLIFLTGAFVPLFLVWIGFFWNDLGGAFRARQWDNLLQFFQYQTGDGLQTGLRVGLIGLLLLVMLIGLAASNNRKGIQIQKFISVLYWFVLVGSLGVFLRAEWRWENLLLMASPVGILLSLRFQGFRTRLWAELWHLGILSFVLFIQFSEFFLKLLESIY